MTVETFLAEATALGIRVPNILELNTELIKDHGKKQVRWDSMYILNQWVFDIFHTLFKSLNSNSVIYFEGANVSREGYLF